MKNYLVIFISFLIFGECYAQDVTSEQAEKVAVNFMKYRSSNTNKANLLKTIKKKEIARKSDNSGSPCYYIINFEEGGYVVVSAYDGYGPILAYSESGSLNQEEIDPGFLWLLDEHSKLIGQLRESKKKDPDCVSSWKKYEGDVSDVALRSAANTPQIGPLLTSKWKQGSPYNDYLDDKGIGAGTTKNCYNNKCDVGCVALAAGQVFRYHKKSLVDFEWNNMPDELTPSSPDVQKREIAKLLSDIGKKVRMNYCSMGCSSSVAMEALMNVFEDYGYKATFVNYIDNTSVLNMLKGENPVIVGGKEYDGEAHTYVIDGCDSNGLFHFNYGLDRLTPDQENGYASLGSNLYKISMKGFLDVRYVGIDCESHFNASIAVKNYAPNTDEYNACLFNPPVYGTFRIGDYYDTYFTYTKTIPAGKNAVYKAYKEVALDYGFTVELGATLSAEIVPCPNQ